MRSTECAQGTVEDYRGKKWNKERNEGKNERKEKESKELKGMET
jgi:hypothetical protein